MKIKKYKLEKVFTEEVDFRMPTQELFLFEYHVRRSIRVTPVYTTWNRDTYQKDEEIYEIQFTIVYDEFNHDPHIIKHTIKVAYMEELYSKSDYKNVLFLLLDFINSYDESNIRTKEQFEVDFNNVLKELM